MQQEWLYRASGAKEGPEVTRAIAEEFGFICRSATAGGAGAMIANVGNVTFGDVIHLYFATPTGGTLLGAFRVVPPTKHPHGEFFGKAVSGSALRLVVDGPLKDRLLACPGYAIDAKHEAYCGWPVVPEEIHSPSYARSLFPGRNALVRR